MTLDTTQLELLTGADGPPDLAKFGLPIAEAKAHPAAMAFPRMDARQFDVLVRDITLRGQLEPVVLCDGLVLDGRHVLRACLRLGVSPIKFTRYEGNDPVGFVVSRNLARRHLSASERALIGARLATLPRGRQSSSNAAKAAITQKTAAEMLRVSADSIQRAGALLAKADRADVEDAIHNIVDAVRRGELSVSLANKIAELPDEALKNVFKFRGDGEKLRQAARNAVVWCRVMHVPDRAEYRAPRRVVELVRKVLGDIDLDVASSPAAQEVVRATRYFAISDNALLRRWHGRIWVNPPNCVLGQFLDKALKEFLAANVSECVFWMTAVTPGAEAFQIGAAAANAVCFARAMPTPQHDVEQALYGSCFLYFGQNEPAFREAFSELGVVLPGGASPWLHSLTRRQRHAVAPKRPTEMWRRRWSDLARIGEQED